MVSFKRALLSALMGLTATAAFGHTSPYSVAFGPYVGAGQISDGHEVKRSSGYSLLADRHFAIAPQWQLGPRLELTNAFHTTQGSDGDTTQLATYDHRMATIGFRLSHQLTAVPFIQGIYMTGTAGRSIAKLRLDQTTNSSFEQNQYSGITGNVYGGEVGLWLPIRENLAIDLSFINQLIVANLEKAQGTYTGDQLVEGQLQLTEGSRNADETGLADRVGLRTQALRLAISMGF